MRLREVVALSLVVFAVGGCGGGDGDGSAAPATPLSTPADATVRMVTSKRTIGAFAPSSLTVDLGAVVEFPNESDAAHDVDFSSASLRDSKIYGPEQNFKATFAAAGTFAYKCTLHPGMKGTITVRPPE